LHLGIYSLRHIPALIQQLPAPTTLPHNNQVIDKKVLAKLKQRVKSTTTIAIEKWTAAIDSGHRIDSGASFTAPSRLQEDSEHENPHSCIVSRNVLAKNTTDPTHRCVDK
jgi:hypothetical protein